jgi:hypothetical protein
MEAHHEAMEAHTGVIEAIPKATWNSYNYRINLCMTHDISIMRRRRITSGFKQIFP